MASMLVTGAVDGVVGEATKEVDKIKDSISGIFKKKKKGDGEEGDEKNTEETEKKESEEIKEVEEGEKKIGPEESDDEKENETGGEETGEKKKGFLSGVMDALGVGADAEEKKLEEKKREEEIAMMKKKKLKKFVQGTRNTGFQLDEFTSGDMGALTEKEAKAEADFERKMHQSNEEVFDEDEDALAEKNKTEIPKVKEDNSGISGSINIKDHERNFDSRDVYSRVKPYTEKVYDNLKEKLAKKKKDIKKLTNFFVRKRLPLEETEDSDVYSLRKKQTILFFVCVIRESQKEVFKLYICKEPEENTPDDPIIEVDLKGKKPWKTYVDPLGGHVIMSCLKDNQATPKHLYINVYHAEDEFKKKKKATDIFTYSAKGEFELRSNGSSDIGIQSVKKGDPIFGDLLSGDKNQKDNNREKDAPFFNITCVSWNIDEWFANNSTGKPDEPLEMLLLGTREGLIFTAKPTDISLQTNQVSDINAYLYKLDLIDKSTPYKFIPVRGIEVFRFDSGASKSTSYIVMITTFISAMLFKGTSKGFKFFDEYGINEKLPIVFNAKKNKNDAGLFGDPEKNESTLEIYRGERKLGNNIETKKKHLGKPYNYCFSADCGVVHGKIIENEEEFFSPSNCFNFLTVPNKKSKKQERQDREYPQRVIMTQFHLYCLYKSGTDSIDIIVQPAELPSIENRKVKSGHLLSKVVYTSYADGYGNGEIRDICPFVADADNVDPVTDKDNTGLIVMTDSEEFYEIIIKKPKLDTWRIYLERARDPTCNPKYIPEFFAKSYVYAEKAAQRDLIKSAEGDFYLSKKRYIEAGHAYAQTPRPFEEIIMKFVNKGTGEIEGIKKYIEILYETETDAVKLTTIAVWLTEIHCIRINRFHNMIWKKYDIECTEEEKNKKLKMKKTAISLYERSKIEFTTFLKTPKILNISGKIYNVLEGCKETIYKIIKSHGLIVEFLRTFAVVVEDYEKLVQHNIYNHHNLFAYRNLLKYCTDDDNSVEKKSTSSESKESESKERKKHMWYKYLPTLMTEYSTLENKSQSVPEIILKDFTDKKQNQSNLKPHKVIPSLLQYLYPLTKSKENKQQQEEEEEKKDDIRIETITRASRRNEERRDEKKPSEKVIKYLDFVINDQKNSKSSIHNLKVQLLSIPHKDPKFDSDRMIKFLKGGEKDYGLTGSSTIDTRIEDTHYTEQYAFSSCLQRDMYSSCVFLYSKMKLSDSAVELALKNNDIQLAKNTLISVKDFEKRRRLLIRILKFCIDKVPVNEKGEVQKDEMQNYRKEGIKLLSEYPDEILLEDIFKILPDDILLDTYVDDINKSLDKYKNENEELRIEMRESTNDSESIRNELSGSQQFKSDVSKSDICSGCNGALLFPPLKQRSSNKLQPVISPSKFYIFPCGHSFHANCLSYVLLEILMKRILIVGEETITDHISDLFKSQKTLPTLDVEKHLEEKVNNTLSGNSSGDYRSKIIEMCDFNEEESTFTLKDNVQIHKSKASKLKSKISDIEHLITQIIEEEKKEHQEKKEFSSHSHVKLDEIIGCSCPFDTKLYVDLIKLPFSENFDEENESWKFHTTLKTEIN
eukprot:gene2272-2446_t